MNDVLSPEEYQMLMDLGITNADLEAALEQQSIQADMLRSRGEVPEGRMIGRVFVPPSITQYASALANQKVAGDMGRAITDSKKQMAKNTGTQNTMVMKAILGANQRPGTQAASTPFDPYADFRRETGGA